MHCQTRAYAFGLAPFATGCSCSRNRWSEGEIRSYFRCTTPRRRSSRLSAVASASWAASTSRFFFASLPASTTNFLFALTAGMARSPLVAKIALARINGKDVTVLSHVILQQPVIVPYCASEGGNLAKVVDLQFQVSPQNLHREIA